jgi:hypothetical protein
MHLCLIEEPVCLVSLGGRQLIGGLGRIAVVQGGRVRHRLVEKYLEHVVGQVVVPLDVPARSGHGVVIGRGRPA